jgi:hypothetical protein
MKPATSLYKSTPSVSHRLWVALAFVICWGGTQKAFAASSNEKVVITGRIVDSTGTPVTNNSVTFDVKVYSPTTGLPGSHCLLYEETQNLDMSAGAGEFSIQVGDGARVGAGPTLHDTFTNTSVASFGSLTCDSGSSYSPGANDDRSVEMTVSFGAQVLPLAAIPVKAVPYAFQANQIGGYGITNLVRLNGSGSSTNLDVDQFNYLTGFFNDNGTSGVLTDDYLDAQNLQIKNLATPTLSSDAATKNYVDTAIASIGAATVQSDGVTLQGDGSAANKLAIKDNGVTAAKIADGNVTMAKIAQSGATNGQVLKWNGTAWAPAADDGLTSESDPTVSDWAKIANPPSARFSTTGNILDLAASGVTANTYGSATEIPIVTVDTYGRITSATTATISTTPTGQALTSTQIWVGNTSNLAEPVAMSGDATLDATGALTLASTGVTASTYTQVTVDAKGRVTAGANPTTLSGYGITDAIQNAGGTPSVQEGTFAAIPSAGTAGRLYLATDNKTLYRDNGTSWDSIGAAGSVTGVTASTPLQSTGGTTPDISFANQNANLVLAGPSTGVAAAPTFRSLVAADLPSAAGDVSGSFDALSVDKIKGVAVSATAPTNNQVLQYNGTAWVPVTLSTAPTGQALTATQFWLGNASNVAEPVSMSGDASMDATGSLTLATVPVTKGGTGVMSYTAGQIPVYDGTKLTGLGCSTGQVLQWQTGTGFGCTTLTGLSPVGSTLTAGQVWVGNASNLAEPVTLNGDVSVTDTGATTVDKLQNSALTITTPASGQILQYNGSAWLNVTPNYQSNALTLNNIWIGNASNIASPIAMPTCSAGYYLTYDGTALSCVLDAGSTGSVTSLATTSPLATSGSTGNVTLSMDLASTHIYVGNASNLAADVAMTGDASIDATGKVSVTGLQGQPVSATVPTSSQVLQFDGTNWAPATLSTSPVGQTLTAGQVWVGNASNLAEPVTLNGDVSVTDTGATTVDKLQNSTLTITTPASGQILQYNGSAWRNVTPNYQSNALTLNNIWVGNASNVASPIAMPTCSAGYYLTYDGSALSCVLDAGSTGSVTSLATTAPLATSGSTGNVTLSMDLASTHIYVGNASGLATDVAMTGDASIDATGKVSVTGINGTAVTGTPTSSQVLQFDGTNWAPATLSTTPTGQALTATQFWLGNASNLAEPVAMSGDATLDATGALTLASTGVTASTYTQVTVDAKGRVTAGTNPTTLSGYGITDAIQNAGGTPSVQEGAFASMPSAGTAGRLYLATDNKTLYRDNGTTWDSIGAAGSVTGVTASTPLQSSGGTTPDISFANQNANLVLAGPSTGVAAAPTFRSLVAADLPTAAGDVSGSFDALSVDKIKGVAVSATAPTNNQILQYNGTAWAPVTLSTTPTGQALTSAEFWLGNASNLAEPVAMTGDATMASTGVLTLATVPVTKGGTGVMSYNLGEIPVYDGTKLTGLGCSTGQVLQWQTGTGFGCTTLTGLSPVGSTLTAGQIWVGNASNAAEPVAASGDVTVDATGKFTVTALQGKSVSSTAPTTGQILQFDGTSWAPANDSATSATNLAGGTAGAIPYQSAPSTTAFDGTHLFWDGTDHRLGLGNTTPQAALSVLANASDPNGYGAEFYGGSVLIHDGTSSEAVSDYGDGILSVTADGGSADSIIRWGAKYVNSSTIRGSLGYNGGSSGVDVHAWNADLRFATDSNIRMKIRESNGYVGINTSGNPGAQLEIDGANGTTLKIVDTNQAAGKVLTSDASGQASWQTPASGVSGLTTNKIPKAASATSLADSSITDNGTKISTTEPLSIGNGTASTQQIQFNGTTVFRGSAGVFIGPGAAAGSTDGATVSIGNYSMVQSGSVTAQEATAVGYGTMYAITSGFANTAIGASAQHSVTTGGWNTAIGDGALYDNTTSSHNTAVGNTAISSLTGGSNTGIGENSGGNANAASYSNIFIGNGAGPSTAATINNKLYINNSQSDTPLIGGDFSNGYVQINKQLELPLSSTTPSPTSGYGRVYAKADGNLYFKNASTEYQLSGASSGVSGLTAGKIPKAASSTSLADSSISDNGTTISTTEPLNIASSSPQIQFGGTAVFKTDGGGVFIGSGAGNGSTDYDTVAINGLIHLTTGTENTAVGGGALYSTTSGVQNTAYGVDSLHDNTTGGWNTAVGDGALYSNTTSSHNTAVGGSALSNLTGGSNVGLGESSGGNASASSSGSLFIGTSAGPSTAGVVTDKLYINNSTSDTPLIYGDFDAGSLTVNGAGGVTATAYYYTSDRRLKKNIVTLDDSLAKILKLRGVHFQWKSDDKPEIGLIAQEVEKVYPDLVTTNDKGMKAVQYGNLVAPLVESTKELYGLCQMSQKQMDDIKAQVATQLAAQQRSIASIQDKNTEQDGEIQKLKLENQQLRQELDAIKKQLNMK